MSRNSSRLILLASLIGITLSSCQSRDESDVSENDPFGRMTSTREHRSGETVDDAPGVNRMAEPRNIRDGDLPPPSLTAEPHPVD